MKKKISTKPPKHPDWRMSRKEKFWYYFSEVCRFNECMLIPNYMNLFLIFQKVDLTVVALITLIVKVVDALDDVAFGFIVDRFNPTRSRLLSKIAGQGKYLPWIRCTLLLFPLCTALFFVMPGSLSQTAKLVWFTVFYLLYDLTYTIVDVPVQGMIVTLTEIPEERNSILTTKIILGTVSTFGLGALWTYLISEHVGMSLTTMALLFTGIFTVGMLPIAFKVKEHNVQMKNTEETNEEKYTLKDMFHALKINKYYNVMILSSAVSGCLATGSAISLFVSFYLYGDSTIMVLPAMLALIPTLLIQSFAPKLCGKYGNRKTAIIGAFLAGALNLIIFFLGYSRIGAIIAVTIATAAPTALNTMAKTYMIPDCVEYAKYKTGKDTAGIFVSINSFLNKISSSIASSLGLLLLGLFGWVSVNAESFADLAAQNVIQPQSALNGLWILNAGIPALGVILAGIFLLFYRLDDKDAKLMARYNAGELTREECERQMSRKY